MANTAGDLTASEPQLRLLIVDDHVSFGQSLGSFIETTCPDIRATIAESLDAVADLRDAQTFDVSLIDVRMPGVSTVQAIFDRLRPIAPERVILISGSPSRRDFDLGVSLGFGGLLSKTMSAKAVVAAIRLVASGERFFPVSLLTGGELRNTASPQLNEREAAALRLLCAGSPNKVISEALGIELSATKALVRGLCQKFDVANRTGVAIRAIELGL